MSLKLGTTVIAGIPANLINTVNSLSSDVRNLTVEVDNLKNLNFVSKRLDLGLGTTNLSSFLPNDGKQYLVWVNGYVGGGSDDYTITATSDIATNGIWVAGSGYDAGRSDATRACALIPIGAGRTITLSTNATNKFSANIAGYCKI